MKRIAVIGYGVIGKRVADAISLQDDMKLSGVCDIISDWRIQNAVRKEYDIYSATQRMEPGSGAKGLIEAIKAENIPTSTVNRFIGATKPLANRIENVGTTLGEGIYNVFNKDPRMQAAADKGLDARMGRTYAENIQAMADPRMLQAKGGRIGYAQGTKKPGERYYLPTKGKEWLHSMPEIDPYKKALPFGIEDVCTVTITGRDRFAGSVPKSYDRPFITSSVRYEQAEIKVGGSNFTQLLADGPTASSNRIPISADGEGVQFLDIADSSEFISVSFPNYITCPCSYVSTASLTAPMYPRQENIDSE